VMVDLGKPQVLKRKVAQALDCTLGFELPRFYGIQKLPDIPLVHFSSLLKWCFALNFYSA
jgi:hypothetical protein